MLPIRDSTVDKYRSTVAGFSGHCGRLCSVTTGSQRRCCKELGLPRESAESLSMVTVCWLKSSPSLHLHLSLNREGRRGHHRWLHNQFPPFFSVLHHGNSRARWSPSFSRSNTWPLSSSWNPSAHLAIVFELLGHPPSDAVLTPATSSIPGRLVVGVSALFLPKDLPNAPANSSEIADHITQNYSRGDSPAIGTDSLSSKPPGLSVPLPSSGTACCQTSFSNNFRRKPIGCSKKKKKSNYKSVIQNAVSTFKHAWNAGIQICVCGMQ